MDWERKQELDYLARRIAEEHADEQGRRERNEAAIAIWEAGKGARAQQAKAQRARNEAAREMEAASMMKRALGGKMWDRLNAQEHTELSRLNKEQRKQHRGLERAVDTALAEKGRVDTSRARRDSTARESRRFESIAAGAFVFLLLFAVAVGASPPVGVLLILGCIAPFIFGLKRSYAIQTAAAAEMVKQTDAAAKSRDVAARKFDRVVLRGFPMTTKLSEKVVRLGL